MSRCAELGLRSAAFHLFGFVLFVGLAFGVPGQDEEDVLVRRCDELAATHHLSGVVLLARDDDVLLERAYGLADREHDVLNAPGTRFYVASLTKAFVAFAALRLVDAGTITLDDRVDRWVPELLDTDAGHATLHQLLAHTSGLPHYETLPELAHARRAYTEEELLGLLAGLEALAPPGEEHHYSGPGYIALGFALERATEEPLPALVRRLVFEPLDLDDTTLVDGTEEPGLHARLYQREGEVLVEVPARDASTLRGAGGVVTTARDLLGLARAIQRGSLLSDASRAILTTPVRDKYACGLIVYANPWLGGRWARHMGSMDGVAAHIVLGLDSNEVGIVLSNVGGTRVNDVNDALILASHSQR